MAEGRHMSDEVINNLTSDSAQAFFSEKYFNREEMKQILNSLKSNCNFDKRSGGFEGGSYIKNMNGLDYEVYRYHFHLSCGDIQLSLTFIVQDTLELSGFKLDSVPRNK